MPFCDWRGWTLTASAEQLVQVTIPPQFVAFTREQAIVRLQAFAEALSALDYDAVGEADLREALDAVARWGAVVVEQIGWPDPDGGAPAQVSMHPRELRSLFLCARDEAKGRLAELGRDDVIDPAPMRTWLERLEWVMDELGSPWAQRCLSAQVAA